MFSSVLSLVITVIVAAFAGDPRCPEIENPYRAIHLPHPTNCGKFLTCNWGDTVVQDCPAGLHWNERQNYCDWPSAAKCAGASNQHESGCIAGELLPHEECRYFYVCINGQKIVLKCPNGLHFNAKANVCDYPSKAQCISQSTTFKPTTVSTTISTSSGPIINQTLPDTPTTEQESETVMNTESTTLFADFTSTDEVIVSTETSPTWTSDESIPNEVLSTSSTIAEDIEVTSTTEDSSAVSDGEQIIKTTTYGPEETTYRQTEEFASTSTTENEIGSQHDGSSITDEIDISTEAVTSEAHESSSSGHPTTVVATSMYDSTEQTSSTAVHIPTTDQLPDSTTSNGDDLIESTTKVPTTEGHETTLQEESSVTEIEQTSEAEPTDINNTSSSAEEPSDMETTTLSQKETPSSTMSTSTIVDDVTKTTTDDSSTDSQTIKTTEYEPQETTHLEQTEELTSASTTENETSSQHDETSITDEADIGNESITNATEKHTTIDSASELTETTTNEQIMSSYSTEAEHNTRPVISTTSVTDDTTIFYDYTTSTGLETEGTQPLFD